MIKKIIHIIQIHFKYCRFVLAIQVVLVISLSLMATLKIYIDKALIDAMQDMVSNYNTEGLIKTVILFGTIMFGDILLAFLSGIIDIKADKSYSNTIEVALISKLNRLEYKKFEDSDTKDVIMRATEQSYQKIKSTFNLIIDITKCILSLGGVCIILAGVSLWYVLFLVFLMGPVIMINYKIGDMWAELYASQTNDERELEYNNDLLTNKSVLMELRVFCSLGLIEKKMKQKTEKLLEYKLRLLKKVRLYMFGKGLLCTVWFAITGFITMRMFLDQKITLGIFVVALESVTTGLVHCEAISTDAQNLSRDVNQSEFLFDFLQMEEEELSEDSKKSISTDVKTIEFRHVYFSYPKTSRVVLEDVSFVVDKYDKVALVGRNGAGKSTIIKLLCKLYKPTSGQILINSIDINDIPMNVIGRMMGIVFQDYFRYDMTIRENVALGDLRRIGCDNEIMDVICASGVEEITKKTPSRLDTVLGKLDSEGIDLSGGQWQKVAFARALFSKASFIILDEPTASLDPVAESNMYELFSNVMKEHTALMISHRLGSSKMAKRILVLDGGKIVEEGSHEELMNAQGMYSEMFYMQAHWYI